MGLRRRHRAKLFSSVIATATAAAGFSFDPTPASAQFFFWEYFSGPRREPSREWRRAPEQRRTTARKKSGSPADAIAGAPTDAKPEAAKLERPLFAVASLADQHVSIYNHRGLVARSAISTGVAGHATPKGIFTIIGRERFHRSNIYSGAPMPFMQRITWSGIAMHLGVVPGHPASHGCIRLPAAFAAKLWGMTRIGERVVIAPYEVVPTEFEHALLPAPKMIASAAPDKAAPAVSDQSSVAPQPSEQLKADASGEASVKSAPAAEQSRIDRPESADPEQRAEQDKVDARGEAAADMKTAPASDPSRDAADSASVASAQKTELPKDNSGEAAEGDATESAKAASAADPRTPPLTAPDDQAATPQQKPEQRQAAVDPSAKAATEVQQRSPAAVRPPLNPLQYAQQLKAKAVGEAAAAGKAVKALTAEVALKRQEAGRALAELRSAEAGQASARVRAASAEAYFRAALLAAASQKEPAETAEREAVAGDARAKAKADRLTTTYGKALIAEDSALLAKTNADSSWAEAVTQVERARTEWAPKSAELADAERRLEEARAAAAAAAMAERDAERRVTPVSILVSKKDRRIYVRQGLSPLFDAPIEIRDPDAPLGSHLFVATAAKEDGTSLKWSVVSIPARAVDARNERRKNLASAGDKADPSWDWRPTGASPAEALERVDIPKDVRDRIAERLWLGASLIISDQPVSGETGNDGTDLTIKLH